MPTVKKGEKIAESAAGFAGPVFSPDGERIAFQREGAVWVLHAGTGREKKLGPGRSPAWLPDGRVIFERDRSIVAQAIEGGSEEVLVSPAKVWKGEPLNPAPSPDGRKIACTVNGLPSGFDKPRKISAFAIVENGSARRLEVECYRGRSAWSMDGKLLLLWSWGAIFGKTIVYDPEASKILYDDSGRWPVSSPSGEKIAFLGDRCVMTAVIEGFRKDTPTAPVVFAIEEEETGPARVSHNPPVWIDENTVIFENRGMVYANGKKGKAEQVGEIELPATRGIPSWSWDAENKRLAVEVEHPDNTFSLHLLKIE